MENKGFIICRRKPSGGLASSFSWRRSAPFGADENNQIVILTPDSEPPSRLPIRPAPAGLNSGRGSLWSVTVAQPSPNLTGFPDI